jgi:hypothetical protein
MIKPPNCYAKSEIPTALKIGYTRFYRLVAKSFPEPDGIYSSENHNKIQLPYWHINTLKEWLDNAGEVPVEKTTKHERMLDKSPWAVPEHDDKERMECMKFRSAYNLMRVGL